MSVDNFRVYDIRMLPAQEIKTISDRIYRLLIGGYVRYGIKAFTPLFYGTPISWEIHNGLQHDTFGIVYQFHRLSQKPSKIRNFTLGELHTAFLS